MSTVNFIIWQTFLFLSQDPPIPHQTFISSGTWIPTIFPIYPSYIMEHPHTIYTQHPQLSRPIHTIYRKLFYSTKLTDHHYPSPQPPQSQPTASSPKQFSSATFAGSLENLSPGRSALFADHSLSEPLRGEFELSANAFSWSSRA